MPTTHLLLLFIVTSMCLTCALAQNAASEAQPPATEALPTQGIDDPRFAPMDEAMQAYMNARDIKAGTLAVRRNGKLIYEKAYGFGDRELTTTLHPDAMFRLASVTKPMTAAAVRCLIEDGKLRLDEKVFEILDIEPLPDATVDERLASITIDHLVHHRGGWERSAAPDPLFNPFRIAQAMNLDHCPTPHDIARYMMGQPLQFSPGERHSYSNFGYMLLGLVIEKRSGMSFEAYMQKRVMNPLGITDCHLARTREDQQPEGEVWYAYQGQARSVLDLADRNPKPWAYGGFSLENQFANGGLVMRARDVARFMETYGVYGLPYKKGENWLHFGAMPGTYTMALWRGDGTLIVALFNQRNGGTNLNESDIKEALDNAATQVLKNL